MLLANIFPLTEFFVLGGIAFYVLAAFIGLWLALVLDTDSFKSSFFALFLFAAAWFVFGDMRHVAGELPDFKTAVLRGSAIYAAGGVVWGLCRWLIFLVSRRRQYERLKAAFLKENPGCTLNDPEMSKKFRGELLDNYVSGDMPWSTTHYPWRRGGEYGGKLCIVPCARDNATRITAWMMYWPISIVSWVLSDFLRWVVCDLLYHCWKCVQSWTAALFDACSYLVMGGVENDLK